MKKIMTIVLFSLGIWYLSTAGYMLAKAELSQYLIKDAWQQTLKDNKNHKPWSWADTYPVFELSIPRLNKTSYILEGASGRNMAFSAARMQIGGMPGQLKSTIISGHRDSHFGYLKELKVGDKIIANTTTKLTTYQVVSKRIIDSTKEKIQIKKHNELILTTCYPFDALQAGGNLRFVIYAEPIMRQG